MGWLQQWHHVTTTTTAPPHQQWRQNGATETTTTTAWWHHLCHQIDDNNDAMLPPPPHPHVNSDDDRMVAPPMPPNRRWWCRVLSSPWATSSNDNGRPSPLPRACPQWGRLVQQQQVHTVWWHNLMQQQQRHNLNNEDAMRTQCQRDLDSLQDMTSMMRTWHQHNHGCSCSLALASGCNAGMTSMTRTWWWCDLNNSQQLVRCDHGCSHSLIILMFRCDTDMTSMTHDNSRDVTMAAPTPHPHVQMQRWHNLNDNSRDMTMAACIPSSSHVDVTPTWPQRWGHNINTTSMTRTQWGHDLNNPLQLVRCEPSHFHSLVLVSRCDTDMISMTTHEMRL